MIKLENISKTFGKNQNAFRALNNISLSVPKGSIYGIIGSSGAGKSTLLRCVNLLEKPDSGQIIIDKQNLLSLSQNELRLMRRKISMIFQHFNLLSSKTVFNNIALPLKFMGQNNSQIKKSVDNLISYMGLRGKENNYPHELSGGQKQRVAIARALVVEPKILLCDEATSALDQKSTKNILELIKKIANEFSLTVLLITHELDVIKSICQRVALLDQGKLIEESEVVEFFSNPKSALAREVVADALKMTVPEKLQQKLSLSKQANKFPLVRIIFQGFLVREAIISKASRLFNIDISILQSNIEYIDQKPVGYLLAELKGEDNTINSTLEYFRNENLSYEVIGYVS